MAVKLKHGQHLEERNWTSRCGGQSAVRLIRVSRTVLPCIMGIQRLNLHLQTGQHSHTSGQTCSDRCKAWSDLIEPLEWEASSLQCRAAVKWSKISLTHSYPTIFTPHTSFIHQNVGKICADCSYVIEEENRMTFLNSWSSWSSKWKEHQPAAAL